MRSAARKIEEDDGDDGTKLVHFTAYIPIEIADEARNAASYLAGPPLHLNLSRLVADALVDHLARLRRSQNGGKAFPPRPSALKHGAHKRRPTKRS